jgi:hypothetical protein
VHRQVSVRFSVGHAPTAELLTIHGAACLAVTVHHVTRSPVR